MLLFFSKQIFYEVSFPEKNSDIVLFHLKLIIPMTKITLLNLLKFLGALFQKTEVKVSIFF